MIDMTHEKLQQMIQDDFARPISEFCDYYVTRSGCIISTKEHLGKKIRCMRLAMDKGGYNIVVLRKDKIKYTKKVHRLVAQTFIPNPNRYPQVNHKDEIKTNNRESNLEWCTASYNLSYRDGQKKRAKGTRKLGKPIARMDMNHNVVEKYDCIGDAKRSGYNIGEIWRCCTGRVKHHKGYKWKYL